ncbi:hypothetical protein [Halobellus sp. GM3]|uniref:hypothetical protein n=1 Tax=Halobellus sp. GM3 TaxID=3458410 RepID=UPI00403D5BEA
MSASLLELAPAFIELLVFSVGSLGLSLAGVYIERFAFATAQTGEPMLGLWAGVMGAVALYFAYLLATDKVSAALTGLGDAMR